jgi:hypothetical protein
MKNSYLGIGSVTEDEFLGNVHEQGGGDPFPRVNCFLFFFSFSVFLSLSKKKETNEKKKKPRRKKIRTVGLPKDLRAVGADDAGGEAVGEDGAILPGGADHVHAAEHLGLDLCQRIVEGVYFVEIVISGVP